MYKKISTLTFHQTAHVHGSQQAPAHRYVERVRAEHQHRPPPPVRVHQEGQDEREQYAGQGSPQRRERSGQRPLAVEVQADLRGGVGVSEPESQT